MKKLDIYIIRKFLGTFVVAITLILMIIVVFDVSERMEEFLKKKPSVSEIVFDYYLNLIPFFGNMFSPLFTFIAVIYFTSRMASRTEIVAILSSGVSFTRILFPYMLSASLIASISLYLSNYVIPNANKNRLAFEDKYLRERYENPNQNIHRQIAPDTYIYMYIYSNRYDRGTQFSLEKIKDGIRSYYLKSDNITWNPEKKVWSVENYFIRKIDGMHEVISSGAQMDTTLGFLPIDFSRRENVIEAMQLPELNQFISDEKAKGSFLIPFYEVEKYKRTAFPFATFVLTLIGASVASRKVRGGIGWHIGLGLTISFTYILFMQVSSTFATNGSLPAYIAVWIPNIVFIFFALFMLKNAPK